MNIGAYGMLGAAAGVPLAQSRGTDAQRAQHVRVHERAVDSVDAAESAAGIGATDGEEHGTSERDADGRRIWEDPAGQESGTHSPDEQPHEAPRQSISTDPDSGSQLDLTG